MSNSQMKKGGSNVQEEGRAGAKPQRRGIAWIVWGTPGHLDFPKWKMQYN